MSWAGSNAVASCRASSGCCSSPCPGGVVAAQRVAAAAPAPGPEAVVRFARRAHQRIAEAVHRRIARRAYAVIRPWVLWRVARRVAVPRLDLARVSRVVVLDAFGVPIGWQLRVGHARRPGDDVGGDVTP